MRFAALAADFDGTLAHDGIVEPSTVAALERLKASGRRLLLVTGRELRDLETIFSRLDLFDLCVMENGATLYFPREHREQPLCGPPPEPFVAALRARGVAGLSVGRVIVATWESETDKVLDAIRSVGLELQVIFNKGALMVLPSGMNKASGLTAALHLLGLSLHNVVGVGDAENDHAFLAACECGAAVANALPSVKERADIVTAGSRGAGVEELVDALLADDLAVLTSSLTRHDVLLGYYADGLPLRFPAYGRNLAISGASAEARYAMAGALVNQLLAASYQVCILDAEGRYQGLPATVVLGMPGTLPTTEDAMAVLEKPEFSLVVNMAGAPPDERARFLRQMAQRLGAFAESHARPHWLIVHEPEEPPSPAMRAANSTNVAVVAPRADDWAADTVISLRTPPCATLLDRRNSSHPIAFTMPDSTPLPAFAKSKLPPQ